MGFPDWFLAPLLRPGERPPGARRASPRSGVPGQVTRTPPRRSFGLRPPVAPPAPKRPVRRS
jgi:hypothetical protein